MFEVKWSNFKFKPNVYMLSFTGHEWQQNRLNRIHAMLVWKTGSNKCDIPWTVNDRLWNIVKTGYKHFKICLQKYRTILTFTLIIGSQVESSKCFSFHLYKEKGITRLF